MRLNVKGFLGATTLAILVGWSLLNIYRTADRTLREHPAGVADPVSLSEARFAELRRELKSLGVRQVGYAMDGPPSMVSRDLRVAWRYYTAQYALAPTVLDFEIESQDYVVGDFWANSAFAHRFVGYGVMREFGDGVVLLRRLE